MTPFELAEPTSLQQAIALLDPDDPAARPLAGGTALMLMMKAGVFRPSRLVSLRRIEPRYAAIAPDAGGSLRIGAMTPLAVLERSPEMRRHAPVVTTTLRTLSNVRVRNVATLGGHLAHGDPHMDLPPVMIALGAHVVAVGRGGTRTIPAEELFVGYYETVLDRAELIAEVVIPPLGQRRTAYLKCTTRAAHDWPAVGVAVSLPAEGSADGEARIVLSAATEKPMRLAAAETAWRDGGADRFRRAAEAAADSTDLTSDAQGSAAYKRQLVRVYVERALRQASGAGRGQ